MNYDGLKLKNQLCFPLYACSREIIKLHKPHLDKLGLTYTQYIAMLVLWEENQTTVKALGEQLYLDSGTLTPLLKKLENFGLIKRQRSLADERNLIVSLTPQGESLKEKALGIPEQIAETCKLTKEEATILYSLLYKMME